MQDYASLRWLHPSRWNAQGVVLVAVVVVVAVLLGTSSMPVAAMDSEPVAFVQAASTEHSTPELAGLGLPAGLQSLSQRAVMKGISYRSWWPRAFATEASDRSMDQAKATGADWISIIVLLYQETTRSTRIFETADTPSDAEIVHAIRRARSLGFKVMLKPQVDLLDASQSRSVIGEEFTREKDWDAWFSSYQSHIERYADIARRESVDLFCIGTELMGTTGKSARWRSLIADTRSLYSGPLTYAAVHSSPTWKGEEVRIDWWDALDYIGVDAYYPITDRDSPTVDQLREGWTPWAKLLSGLASRWRIPVILTEVGYRNLDGASKRPWDCTPEGKPNLGEQENNYEAALQAVWNQPWFAGMFWWEWGTNPNQGAPEDTGFTPRNRPAEQVLQRWFGGLSEQ